MDRQQRAPRIQEIVSGSRRFMAKTNEEPSDLGAKGHPYGTGLPHPLWDRDHQKLHFGGRASILQRFSGRTFRNTARNCRFILRKVHGSMTEDKSGANQDEPDFIRP